MKVRTLFWTLVFLFPVLGQAYCPEIDLSPQLGPVRDQEEDGICHVAASSTLVTQLLHAKGIKKDFQPSWLDAMNCADPKNQLFQLPNQGGVPRQSLNCMLGKGVCEEKEAPYSKRVYLDCQVKTKHRCASPELQKKCHDREEAKLMERRSCGGLKDRGGDVGTEIFKHLQDVPATAVCTEGSEYFPPRMSCLRDHLVPQSCQKNRVKLPGDITPKEIDLEKRTTGEKADLICGVLKKNRAMVLALCLNRIPLPAIQKMMGIFKKSGENCQGAHGVVVAGTKMIHGTLHYFIRNSWGADSPFEGWVPAEKIYDSMMYGTYLGEKSEARAE